MVEAVEGPLHEITEQEGERALKFMKSGRAAGLCGLTSDMIKFAGHMGVTELMRVFQKIMRSGTVSREWGHCLTIPLYKGKGGCTAVWEIKRFEAVGDGMNIWERGIVQKTSMSQRLMKINLVLRR